MYTITRRNKVSAKDLVKAQVCAKIWSDVFQCLCTSAACSNSYDYMYVKFRRHAVLVCEYSILIRRAPKHSYSDDEVC